MKLKLLVLLLVLSVNIFAQSPKLMNYQASARRSDGNVLANRVLGVKFELIEGPGSGTVVSSETQTILTNALGLFVTQIGKSGLNFLAVNWQNGPHYLQVGIDTTGALTNFTGTYQNLITAVPFAFNADHVPGTYTNNVLTIGKNTYTIVSAVAPSVTTQGNISSTVQGNSFSLTVPNPTLTVTNNSLSISNGNTVVLPAQTSQTLVPLGAISITNGVNSYTISSPAQISQTIVGNGMANVTNGINTATVSVPNPTLTILNNSLSINGGNTVILPSQTAQTINAQGVVTVTNGLNSATITVANPVLFNTANVLSISQGTAISTVTLPAVSNASFVNTGVISVNTISPNSFSLNVPAAIISNTGNVLSISQGTAISTVTVPVTHTIVSSGIAAVSPSAGSVFTVSVPAPTLTANSNTLTISQGTVNSTVTLPAQITQTITGAGIASVNSPASNSFVITVNQPTYAYSQSNGSLTSGTSSAYITPSLSLSGSTITSGPSSNSVSLNGVLPWTQTNGTITPRTATAYVGIGTNNPVTPLEVAATATTGTILKITGTNPNNLNGDILSISNGLANINAVNTHTSGSGIAVTSIGNAINVTNTGPFAAIFATSTNTATNAGFFSGGIFARGSTTNAAAYAIYAQDLNSNAIFGVRNDGNVGIGNGNPVEKLDVNGNIAFTGALKPNGSGGTVGQFLMSQGLGSAPVWTAVPSNTFAYSQTNGSLTSGTSSVYITPSISLSGNTITSGPASNSINLSPVLAWTQNGNTVTPTNGASNVGIGISNPSHKFEVFTTTTSPTFAQYSTFNFNPSSNPGGAAGAGYFMSNFNGTGGTQLNTAITGYLSLAGGASSSSYNTGAWLHGISQAGSHNNLMGILGSTEVYGANIGNVYGGYFTHMANTGTVTNGYGVYVGSVFGNNKWSLYSSDASAPNYFAGKIGIGNTAPTASLDINGTLKYVDGSQGAGKVLTSDASGNATWSTTATSAWGLSGNAGTTPSVNFIGTTDTPTLNFKVNNVKAGLIDGTLYNTALGYGAYGANTTGSLNAAFGYQAMGLNTTGFRNAGFGYMALYNNTSGVNNTAVGYQALFGVSTGQSNIGVGFQALGNNNGSSNIGIGANAMLQNTTGQSNIAIGLLALYPNVSGNNNNVIGTQTFWNNTGGSNNVSLGAFTGYSNVTGSGNVFLGSNAGYYEMGSNKLYIANSTTSTTPLVHGDFSNGRLGINTTNLTGILAIDAQSLTAPHGIHLQNTRDQIGGAMPLVIDQVTNGQTFGTNTYGRMIRFSNSTTGQLYDMGIGSANNYYIAVGNNYSPAAFNISNAGNIGISTQAPAYKLDIVGTGGPRARVYSQDGNFAGYLSKNSTSEFFAGVQGTYEAANGTNSGYHIYDNIAGARRMVIDYLGRMGVNNSAPTATLDVAGTFKLADGTQGTGKVLTSDASGNASWATAASPSRVRSIVIEPGAMNVTSAYAAVPATYSMVGGWQRPCVVMADGLMSQIQLHIPIPTDWNTASTFTVRILYGSPGTSGIFDMQTLTSNIGLNASAVSASSGSNFTLSQSSTVEGLSEYQFQMTISSTSKVIQLTLRRNGSSGTDTSTDPMRLYGIAFDYRD